MAEQGSFEAEQRFNDRWEQFKIEHKREYDPEEDERRKEIYRETVEMVEAHNAKFDKGLTTYKMGINFFADMTADERAKYTGLRIPQPN
ncbi:hypothetical protein WA026_018514 [Henosepilachna vigintioctopunctata]|uniref:Cathepsin propeptide inhibitor domain-containing protein n=1 Tax=Henosepilachna vigintioctopunctata TaxID=420089 RepID=A0AAW1V3V0_9CUCU